MNNKKWQIAVDELWIRIDEFGSSTVIYFNFSIARSIAFERGIRNHDVESRIIALSFFSAHSTLGKKSGEEKAVNVVKSKQ